MPIGKLCILSEPFTVHLEKGKYVSDAIKSNVFTYEVSDHDIIGGSVNMGDAPSPFSLGEVTPAPVIVPVVTNTKGKRK